jgi:hypothetical protein
MRRLGIAVSPRAEAGSALVVALALVLVLSVAGVALIRIAGADRSDAGELGRRDRGMACAEAGLQYARRFFGTRYETTNGWNDYLGNTTAGYRYDPGAGDDPPSPLPGQVRGASDGATLDAGADVDGDGQPDFWVSIRDDDDERPFGLANNPARDNNERVIVRSECTNPAFAMPLPGNPTGNTVVEGMLLHVQGSSGYGTAQRQANATDLVGGR